VKVRVPSIEFLDELGEGHQRAAEPIDLVDDCDVDAAFFDTRGSLAKAASIRIGNHSTLTCLPFTGADTP
jgi:hypothetical protein